MKSFAASQSPNSENSKSFFSRVILFDPFTAKRNKLNEMSGAVQAQTMLDLGPSNKVVLSLPASNGNSHKRELEKEKSSVSTDSGTSGSTNANASNGSSKLSKIGKRLRESCRNLRGKSSPKYNPDDFSTVPKQNDSNRTRHYVAMDFSGKVGRIVDQKDVRGYTTKDGYAYFRRKVSPKDVEPLLTKSQASIHLDQPWFHPNMGRDLAQRILTTHNIDGAFLVRDSSVSGGYVISYVSGGRTYHAQILPDTSSSDPEGGRGVFFTLDDGKTRFYDLLQLVEFYELNRGSLNSKLTYRVVKKEVTKSEESSTVRCDDSSSGQVSESSMESQTPIAAAFPKDADDEVAAGIAHTVASFPESESTCCTNSSNATTKMDTNHNSHDAKANSCPGDEPQVETVAESFALSVEDAAMASEGESESLKDPQEG